MLVLTRKSGEVLNFDEELYVEIEGKVQNGKHEGKIKVYVYNKLKDEEYIKYLLRESVELTWGNKRVSLILAEKYSKTGNKQVKIGIEADNSIKVKREMKIDYAEDRSEELNQNSQKSFEDDEEYESLDNEYSIKFEDELVNKYKNELSWFYN